LNHRRVSGLPAILALTAVLLLALWACSPAPAPVGETPEATEPSKKTGVDDENQNLLDDFEMLEAIASTGRIIVRITSQGPNNEASACTRRIRVQTFGPTIFWGPDFAPREVTWQVAQQPSGTWMEGDRIHIERKVSGDDRCFAEEPFDILYPDMDVESGQPLENCQIELPFSRFWTYKATLFNEECESDENPDGKVASWDPLVIIKKRP
jgi:hypothetical protein